MDQITYADFEKVDIQRSRTADPHKWVHKVF